MGAIPQSKRDRHHLDILASVVARTAASLASKLPYSRQLALDVTGVSRDLG
jgi:hypothetical protein